MSGGRRIFWSSLNLHRYIGLRSRLPEGDQRGLHLRNERQLLPGGYQGRVTPPLADRVRELLDWFLANRRNLPWRRARDPYRIWVSEVMLQQTRVEAVLSYYERFIGAYPTLAALAAAPRSEVLANWAGLGYYRRAGMLHAAAQQVIETQGGRFPSEYDSIKRLPGIGEYTAAAVSSIAFDEPRAAMDGNAYRVLARLVDDRRDIRSVAVRKALRDIAQRLMDTTRPGERGDFSEALMELGATVCVPRIPRCDACPWMSSCAGRAAGSAPALPVKPPRRAPRRAEIAVVVIQRDGQVLMRQRPPDASIMPGFWELPTAGRLAALLPEIGMPSNAWLAAVGKFSHSITDTVYTCRVYEARAYEDVPKGHRWVTLAQTREIPVATISAKALRVLSPAEGTRAGERTTG